MNELLGVFARALSAGGVLAFPIALLGGFIAALNPCCLALYPAAAATCCGVREVGTRSGSGTGRKDHVGRKRTRLLLAVSIFPSRMLAAASAATLRLASPYRSLRHSRACFRPCLRGFERKAVLRSTASLCVWSGRGDSVTCSGQR